MENTEKKPKILLVDDDEAARWAGRYALDEWFDIKTTGKNKEALELLEKEKFDLILLDIVSRYEGENAGIDTLTIINKKYPSTPVVMFSGSLYWISKWSQLKKLGASGYLNKPFDRSRAKEILEKCLKGEKMEQVYG